MKPVIVVAFALVLLAIQASFLRFVGGGTFSIALALPCVVYLGLHAGNVDGALGSAGIGYLLDVMAGGPKGLMTFLAMVLFLASRVIGAGIDIRGRFGFALLSAVETFVFGFCVILLRRVVSPPEAMPSYALLSRIAIEAVLTGVAAPLVGAGMRRIDGLFAREETGLLS